ncbi:protein kilB (plasmid) [Streptomyces alfalfae]|uniref:protein kilB n=1 Tax=Streptomyces alfalfae TaxID=1642299 RepID=UPI001BA8D059|nr:protein kilB [Streptomyces alfalfae]QUI36319.1 protein kilB [Streptomyces alfalfae]
MVTAIVAVLGTLAGSLMTGVLQHYSQRTARRLARQDEQLDAVAALVGALTEHRRAMWTREHLRMQGADWEAARTESHRTRSAITIPLLRLQLLVPALADTAHVAAHATYALRGAWESGETGLAARREHAITKTDDLVTAVGHHFAA